MEPKEFETLLEDLEQRLERLRVLYEQWFQGFERIEPSVPRKDVERRMQRLRRESPRNTALRFRFQTLWQRYTTLQTYWGRIARQIEEGTYRRDLMKARKRRQARRQELADRARGRDAHEIDVEVDLDELDTDAEVEAALAALQPARSRPPAAESEASGAEGAKSPSAAGSPKAPSSPPKRTSISPFAMSPSKRPPEQGAAASGGPVKATFGKPTDPLAGGRGDGAAAAPPTPGASRPATPQPKRPPPPGPAKPPRTPGANRPATPGAKRPATPAASPGGLGEDKMRRIYSQYVEARRRNNQPTDNVDYAALKRSVDKMVPKLREKHKGKDIDFDVVVRNGKVGLKPKSGG